MPNADYCNPNTDAGNWPTPFLALPFLHVEEIDDCFVKNLISAAPQDSRYEKCSDHVLNTYISETCLQHVGWDEKSSESQNQIKSK